MFIPLIPLDSGIYVECDGCKKQYKELVLESRFMAAPASSQTPQLVLQAPIMHGPAPFGTQTVFASVVAPPSPPSPTAPTAPLAPPQPVPISPMVNPSMTTRIMTDIIRGTNIAVLRSTSAGQTSREQAVRNIEYRIATYDFHALEQDLQRLDLSGMDATIAAGLNSLPLETAEIILGGLAKVAYGAELHPTESATNMVNFIAGKLGIAETRAAEILDRAKPVITVSIP
jgi:hypothetical protein